MTRQAHRVGPAFTARRLAACAACAACAGACQTAAVAPAEPAAQAGFPELPASAADYRESCDADWRRARAMLDALERSGPPHDVAGFVGSLDHLFAATDNGYSLAQLYANVHPDAGMSDAAEACQLRFAELDTEIGLSGTLHRRLMFVDGSAHDALARRYLSRLRRDFRRAGVDRPDAVRERVRALRGEITELGQRFSRNIREDARRIALAPGALAGLPGDYVAVLERDAEGRYLVSTDYPESIPFMRYAHDDAARWALHHQSLNRGHPANAGVLRQILERRHELARLLGYRHYADYATEVMMSKDARSAARFIQRIDRAAGARADADYRQLLGRLQRMRPEATEVGAWQKSYIESLIKRERYHTDDQAIRRYFAFGKVRDGLIALIERLFRVDIAERSAPVWHERVLAYEMRQDGQPIGYFYLDLHPRDGKYRHAAHFSLRTGLLGRQLPVSVLVCNFPGGEAPGQFMEHRQVETFLHEFGHLAHHLIGGRQRWFGLSGIATEHDFVEAPSQMLEEWAWDAESLREFATDGDGQPIPASLVERMRAAREFGRGTFTRNQMFYAALSLHYYSRPPEKVDLLGDMIALQRRYSPFGYVPDTHFYSNFGHLFGYSAAYYAYMWSQVIAADILERFREAGLFDERTARRYRNEIIAAGGSADAAELVRGFLGRPYDERAFMRALDANVPPAS